MGNCPNGTRKWTEQPFHLPKKLSPCFSGGLSRAFLTLVRLLGAFWIIATANQGTLRCASVEKRFIAGWTDFLYYKFRMNRIMQEMLIQRKRSQLSRMKKCGMKFLMAWLLGWHRHGPQRRYRKALGSFQRKVRFSTQGEAMVLLGASGCGKSLTLNALLVS